MKSRDHTPHRILIGVIVIAVAVGLALGGRLIAEGMRARQRLVRLLCKTDYEDLLTSCRQLSLRTSTGELNPGDYWVRVDKQPRLAEVPEAILSVDPLFIHIDRQGYVLLEMGGIPYWGVIAYPGTSRDVYPFQGSVELIPGLWYYDEDYSDEHPRHRARIDTLIGKGKRRNQTH